MGLDQDYTQSSSPTSDVLYLDELRSDLVTSEILYPGTESFLIKVKRWSDSAQKQAGAILLARSAEDIAVVVRHVRKYHIDIAVCGGGHSVSGASSSDGGIVVDLSKLRQVTVDPTSRTITAQGGCIWADVDGKSAEYGLATVAGTVNHTGVGGLTLGGGYGWLSGEHGLTIDNLVAIQMVLADGSITTADESKNADLFWAVRGAGHSFGIATEFTFRAHPQREEVFSGRLAFIPPKLPHIVDFINNNFVKTLGKTAVIVGFAVAPPPVSQPCIVTAVFHNGTEDEARDIFKPLFDLGPVNDATGMMPYRSVNGMLNHVAGHGGRKAMKGAAFALPLRPVFIQSVYAEFARFVTQNPDAGQSIILLECLHSEKICQIPHSATAFAHRGQQLNTVLLSRWHDAANDALGREQVRTFAGMFEAEMQARRQEGTLHMEMESKGGYCNYEGFSQTADRLYGPNTARLLALKVKLDPHNLFNKSHLQTPLLN